MYSLIATSKSNERAYYKASTITEALKEFESECDKNEYSFIVKDQNDNIIDTTDHLMKIDSQRFELLKILKLEAIKLAYRNISDDQHETTDVVISDVVNPENLDIMTPTTIAILSVSYRRKSDGTAFGQDLFVVRKTKKSTTGYLINPLNHEPSAENCKDYVTLDI